MDFFSRDVHRDLVGRLFLYSFIERSWQLETFSGFGGYLDGIEIRNSSRIYFVLLR
jgi:hypothetical protein